MDVVMQGIRIRLGRSLVTISGVVLGIAFLMSILTGQIIKTSVRDEQSMRDRVGRLSAALLSQTGPLVNKNVAVIANGELAEVELRFLNQLKSSTNSMAIATGADASAGALELDAKSPEELVASSDAWVVVGQDQANWSPPESLPLNTVVAYVLATPAAADSAVSAGILLDKPLPEAEQIAAEQKANQENVRSIWIITISLLVTVIGISNAMLMSVTERFREIGTMKCLGALSAFVRRLFLIESSLMGFVGGIAGAIGGVAFAVVAYGLSYGILEVITSIDMVMLSIYLVASVGIAIVLSVIAALYPAIFAARMVPATALRSNI